MASVKKHAAPTIVFLHGVGLDHTMWLPIRDMFPASSLYLDLPGHGDQPPIRDATTLQQLADDVTTRLPDTPIQLVGFSLGGLIAQRIALDLPNKVVSVVAASTVCNRTAEERESVMTRLETARQDFALSIQRSLERWYPTNSDVTSTLIEQTHAVLANNDVQSFLHAYEVFATADRELYPQLAALHQPLLAITGERDPGSTPDMSRRLAEAVPNATVKIVPHARHMLPHEQPRAFVRYVRDHFAFEEVAKL